MSTKMTPGQKKATKLILTICPLFLGGFILVFQNMNPNMISDPEVGNIIAIVSIAIGICVIPVWKWAERGKINE